MPAAEPGTKWQDATPTSVLALRALFISALLVWFFLGYAASLDAHLGGVFDRWPFLQAPLDWLWR